MKKGVQIEVKGINALLKALSEKPPIARVGVLGDKNARKKEGEKTNAEIGAKHEFGEDGMPIRSFLRMPLTEHLQTFLEASGLFGKDTLVRVLKTGTLRDLVNKIGAVGVVCVNEAFNTGGWGKWTPSNMRFKKNKQTLVETQQLRNSIGHEVIDK